MSKRILLRSATLAVLLLVPLTAYACPMCFQGKNEESQIAFIVSTAFMTLLPLLVIGGAIWVVRKRVKKLEARDEAIAAEPAE